MMAKKHKLKMATWPQPKLCEARPSGVKTNITWAMEKRLPGCLGDFGDEILPSFVGITIEHYKDPY